MAGRKRKLSQPQLPTDFMSLELESESETEEETRPAGFSWASPRAASMDWSCTDLMLDHEMMPGGLRLQRAPQLLPGLWAFARGRHGAYQGRHSWRVKIPARPKANSLLFGVLVQWPGCQPLPGPGESPHLVLLADSGEHVFTSGLSGDLLRTNLLRGLRAGDVVEVQADFSQRRLRFRLGPEEAEVSLPGRRDTARSSGAAGPSRLREAAFHFFVALREGAVELSEPSGVGGVGPRSTPEALVLAGPQGSGKTRWAQQAAAASGIGLVLNAEWLLHRSNFCEAVASDDEDLEVTDPAKYRQKMAELLAKAFSLPDPEEPELKALGMAEARRLLPEVLPSLLARAAQRGVGVVADDEHLQAQSRARVRAALVRFPGRVRWVVVIPDNVEELQRRIKAREAMEATATEPEVAGSASLPGDGEAVPVEYAEGSAAACREVFRVWQGHVRHPEQSQCVQSFFEPFGEVNGFVSTEGMRRY